MNDQFDEWLKDTIPEVERDETRQEIQLAVLKERLRQRAAVRRRRFKGTMIVLPVLLLAIVAGNVPELGSDGFEYERLAATSIPGEVIKTGFREDAVNLPAGTADADVIDIGAQIAANMGIVVEVEGWKIGSDVYWSMTRINDVAGKEELLNKPSLSPQSRPSRKLYSFSNSTWPSIRANILSGSIAPSGKEDVVLDGESYTTTYWNIVDESIGNLTYYRYVANR